MLEKYDVKKEQYEIITKNRAMIETLVLGSFLKDLDLYGEYKLNESDFIIDKIKFFFSLGKVMSKNHYELDEATVLNFIKSNKDYKKKYEEYGGWESLSKAISFGNENNAKAYIDDLFKNNLCLKYHEQNIFMTWDTEIDGVEVNPFNDLFPTMTSKEVSEYFDGVNSKCSVQSMNTSLKSEGLILRKEHRELLKQKVDAGTPYDITFTYTDREIGLGNSNAERYVASLPQLSTITSGLGNANGVSILAGFSGIGKSTMAVLNFILPMAYRKEKCAIFANENKVQYIRSLICVFVARTVFKNRTLTRQSIESGDFTEGEEILMDKIEKFLDDRDFDEYIRFYQLEEFDIDEIISVSKGLVTHEGFSCILIDTFKSEDSSNENYTGSIIENSKKLDNFGNKYNIKIFMTMQLVTAYENSESYLSASSLAEAKATKNVADLLFLMREVVNELELDPTNKKYYLQPYKVVENKRTGGVRREPIEFTADDLKKDYRIIFLNKSRRGQSGINILVKFDGESGKFTEIGLVSHVHRGVLRR